MGFLTTAIQDSMEGRFNCRLMAINPNYKEKQHSQSDSSAVCTTQDGNTREEPNDRDT